MSKILIFILSLMFCLPTMAGERSEQQILDAAAGVLCKQRLTRSLNGERYQPLRIVQRRGAITIVGAEGGGFALVSNDESQRPVLGYSREGTFDPEGDLPCGLKWYLDALDKSLTGQPPLYAAILPGNDVKPYVEPLIETDWWQVSPYNDWLPTYTNENGVTKHFYTGCAMTAAAQLMYYYKYPDKPHGEITYSYDPFEDGRPIEVSCVLDTITFDWNHIAPIYNDRRSDDEQENIEVARLFYAIDNAWHAQYKPNGTWTGISYLYPFYTNFDYCRDCRGIMRDNYNDQLWMSMVFNELSNGHPIIYRGEPSAPNDDLEGHAFIVDGYDANGLIHINWGWGRKRGFDGYFSIDALVPNNYNHDYNDVQAMYPYIRPKGQSLTITSLTVSTPGTLGSLLTDNPLQTRLKISGRLNADDLQALKLLGQQAKGSDGLIVSELTHLDLTDATLPDDMLPESAFESCTALLDVVLPTSLKVIGNRAFLGCSRLVHVGMPSGLRTIGHFAFLSCSSLADIVIPCDVETIGNAAFGYCISNEAFTVESGNSHFSTIDGMLTNVEGTKLVCFPAKRSEATIPGCIDTIGLFAFRSSVNLTELHIPSTVRVVEDYAFMYCINVSTVTFDEGVEEIKSYAFYSCSALTEVYLPASLKTIGNYILYGCSALTDVYCQASTPYVVGNNVFAQADLSLVTLHVPQGCRAAYQASTGWSQFGTIIDDLPGSAGIVTTDRSPANTKRYDLMGRPLDARTLRRPGIVIEPRKVIITQ